MNYRIILYVLGWVLNILGICLLPSVAFGIYYHETTWKCYLLVAAVCFIFGALIIAKKPKKTVFYAREGFVAVALSWIMLSVLGAVPFFISGEIPSFVDAVFETASGFTTTGASILTNISSLSKASLFWRSFTHWIGGMGVLVFILTVIPLATGSVMQLMRAESPGPETSKFVPKAKQTALILYAIYSILTALEFLILFVGGMPWFDAITTAFATAGTGGFSIHSSSMAFYDSNFLQATVTVFMILFGVNFNLYFLLLRGKFKSVLKSEELRCFLIVIFASILLITLNIFHSNYGGHVYPAFHDAAFSVASVISTTGFATADFNTWPQLSRFILFMLMFIGACAGSTGGGMKISRLVILVKSAANEIKQIIHPRGIHQIKFDKKRVNSDTVKNTSAFFVISIIVFVSSVFIVSFDNFDMTTSLTAVAATLNNIGPGLGKVGPVGNYSEFSALSKIVMIFDMLLGRLEYFPLLVLVSPATWKGSFSAIKRRLICKKDKIKSQKKNP